VPQRRVLDPLRAVVEEHAVGRPFVAQLEAVVGRPDDTVPTRHGLQRQADVRSRGSSHHRLARFDRESSTEQTHRFVLMHHHQLGRGARWIDGVAYARRLAQIPVAHHHAAQRFRDDFEPLLRVRHADQTRDDVAMAKWCQQFHQRRRGPRSAERSHGLAGAAQRCRVLPRQETNLLGLGPELAAGGRTNLLDQAGPARRTVLARDGELRIGELDPGSVERGLRVFEALQRPLVAALRGSKQPFGLSPQVLEPGTLGELPFGIALAAIGCRHHDLLRNGQVSAWLAQRGSSRL
jgi:hypothetical protein